jgi:ribosomal protein L1
MCLKFNQTASKSTEELKEKIMSFIDYFNKTMAKPFKWTYQGKVMVVSIGSRTYGLLY